jgi:tRNA(Ile)-lysidine synthase
MLLLFCKVAPRNFCVATVDHGLRAESADEAAMVASVCAARGIAHRTLKLSLEKGSAVQERARAARYAALVQWAREEELVAVITAHHADDQAETMVMRLNRGAGLRGLAAMRTVAHVPGAPDLPLIRPFLSWRRAELHEVVAAAGLAAADDPSNRDPGYERVRTRDALTSSRAFDVKGFASSARHLAEADEALEWAAAKLWNDVAQMPDALIWSVPADLPDTLCRRVLERVLSTLDAPVPRGPDLARWLETLRLGGVATLGGVKGDARKGAWRFTRAPKPRH